MRDIDISNYSKEIIINGFDEIQNSAKKLNILIAIILIMMAAIY